VTNQLTLSQVIANFIHYKEAIGRSEHTIADYHGTRARSCWSSSPMTRRLLRSRAPIQTTISQNPPQHPH
jgi:hypothetical protein